MLTKHLISKLSAGLGTGNRVASATIKTSAKHYAERRDGHKSPRIALLAAMMIAIMMGIIMPNEAWAQCPDNDGQGMWTSYWIEMQPDPNGYCMPLYRYCCRENIQTGVYEYKIMEMIFADQSCIGYDGDVGGNSNGDVGGGNAEPAHFTAWYMQQVVEHLKNNIFGLPGCAKGKLPNCAENEIAIVQIGHPVCMTAQYQGCDENYGFVWKISSCNYADPTNECKQTCTYCWEEDTSCTLYEYQRDQYGNLVRDQYGNLILLRTYHPRVTKRNCSPDTDINSPPNINCQDVMCEQDVCYPDGRRERRAIPTYPTCLFEP